jgi:hypothetical protein
MLSTIFVFEMSYVVGVLLYFLRNLVTCHKNSVDVHLAFFISLSYYPTFLIIRHSRLSDIPDYPTTLKSRLGRIIGTVLQTEKQIKKQGN